MSSETAGYRFHHTMLRVKDITKSLHFYEDLLGMKLCFKRDFPHGKFTLYFLSYVEPGTVLPTSQEELARWVWSTQRPFVELTHNWGTESDASFGGYHNGNKEPRGFGHLAIVVPDVDAAVKRFEANGVEILKRPDQGSMKGFAFIADPDGYWVEVLKDNDTNGVC
eukprot:TRINITY_DN10614_c0_g1_i2.p1 TRINITY_DN10614_c0_g1~~TRINITY_DN10614_c0_g1_i2.p1  ORF type:complete len:166 (-),score=60.36 TRINITY_DN10614_c0_g1_i2:291-788(-)